jgi:hypothetical protein
LENLFETINKDSAKSFLTELSSEFAADSVITETLPESFGAFEANRRAQPITPFCQRFFEAWAEKFNSRFMSKTPHLTSARKRARTEMVSESVWAVSIMVNLQCGLEGESSSGHGEMRDGTNFRKRRHSSFRTPSMVTACKSKLATPEKPMTTISPTNQFRR